MYTPISVGDFIQKTIPQLISGKEASRILFSTYKTICDYADGTVETGDPNLQVVIATGGVEPPSWDFIFRAMLSPSSAVSRASTVIMRAQAAAGQSEVGGKLSGVQHPDIAVVYAGLTGFASAVRTVWKLHQQSPETFIAVLTCDCDLRTKEWELEDVDGIGALIVTSNCGGRGEMRDILNAFRDQWPSRPPAAQTV